MTLRIEGDVETPRELSFSDLASMPQLDVAAKVPGREGGAVAFRAVLDAARPKPSARFATLVSGDGEFAIAVPLELVADNALVAYRLGDGPLPEKKGGPIRFFVLDVGTCGTGEVDECANVKRLAAIRLTREREPDVGHVHVAK